jgi:hypothetical protein
MKSLLTKLGVVLIGLTIFGNAEGWGEDWKYYGETDQGKHYYDADSVIRPSKETVRVWRKILFTRKAVNDMTNQFGQEYKALSYMSMLFEFHCGDKKFCVLSVVNVSRDGKVIESFDYQDSPNWIVLRPGAIDGILCEIVCKQP